MARVRKRITQKSVLMLTGFTEAALNVAVAQGVFPAPVHKGKLSLWLAFDVLDYSALRICGDDVTIDWMLLAEAPAPADALVILFV